MKKLLKILLITTMLVAFAYSAAYATTEYDASFAESLALNGFGTEASPVEISTASELFTVSSLINDGSADAASGHYKLTSDLDLKEVEWLPIGTEANPFKGTFDGDGKKILNMTEKPIITDAFDNIYFGLFGVTEDAAISNLTLTRDFGLAEIEFSEYYTEVLTAAPGNNVYIGGIAGHAKDTTLTNVTVKDYPVRGMLYDTADLYVGGLIGYGLDVTLNNSKVEDVNLNNPVVCFLNDVLSGEEFVNEEIGKAEVTEEDEEPTGKCCFKMAAKVMAFSAIAKTAMVIKKAVTVLAPKPVVKPCPVVKPIVKPAPVCVNPIVSPAKPAAKPFVPFKKAFGWF